MVADAFAEFLCAAPISKRGKNVSNIGAKSRTEYPITKAREQAVNTNKIGGITCVLEC